MAKTLRFTEGDAFIETVTVKRAGAAVDLTVYDVISLDIHDDTAAFGTNFISLTGVKDPDQVTNKGKVTFTFLQTNTQLPTGKTDLYGHWSVLCRNTANTLRERSDQGKCVVIRNPFVVI